ncbi:MAG: hypothetical protein K5765_06945 [Clostridia bacterium]|nr:hypothetical protein [Clostridia bacterium]
MTRGQIAIITNEGVMTSTEFNGDMYMPTRNWAGHGRKVINALKRVCDIADYHFEVAKFNKENHHYVDTKLVYMHNGYDMLDMEQETYFEKWFSDYVYIKNLKNEMVELKSYDGKIIKLAPQEIAVMNFGTLQLKA